MPYKLIELTRGVVAAIDTEDFERVNEYSWTPRVREGKVDGVQAGGNKKVRLHRLIMGLKHGDKQHVDHWNGNVYDNRRCNLRICSNAENQMNRKKLTGTKSQYKGVSPITSSKKHPFKASIGVDGRCKYLGGFATEVEAAKAYDTAARKYFGEFVHPNFPTKAELGPEPPPEVVDQKLQPTNDRKYTGNREASKFVGVFRSKDNKDKWRWRLRHKGRSHGKVDYPTQEAAARAREDFIIKNNRPHPRTFLVVLPSI